MTKIVSVDIGGTHARFALAEVADGRVLALDHEVTFRTADHPSLESAWEAFGAAVGQPPPRACSLAVACPVEDEVLQLTNSTWVIRRAQLAATLEVEHLCLVNDFAAVAHAIAQLGPEHLQHVCGPFESLPDRGPIGGRCVAPTHRSLSAADHGNFAEGSLNFCVGSGQPLPAAGSAADMAIRLQRTF